MHAEPFNGDLENTGNVKELIEDRLGLAYKHWAPWDDKITPGEIVGRYDELFEGCRASLDMMHVMCSIHAQRKGYRTYVCKDNDPAHRQLMWVVRRVGTTVRPATDLDEFLELSRKTFRHRGMKIPHADALVRRLDEAATTRADRDIRVAVAPDGSLHAGAYIVRDPDTAYCLMGGGQSGMPDQRGRRPVPLGGNPAPACAYPRIRL